MYLLRTKADCPEIDDSVLTRGHPLETGAFYKVTVTDSDTWPVRLREEELED